jgi:DNA-binding MarR family transcriptional regulator
MDLEYPSAPSLSEMQASGLCLLRMSCRLNRLQERVLSLSDAGITFHQYLLLLRIQSGADSLTLLAESATMSMPAISTSITILRERGFIARARRREARRMQLRVTPAGEAAMEVARFELDALTEDLLRYVNPAQAAIIDDLSEQLWKRAGDIYPRRATQEQRA